MSCSYFLPGAYLQEECWFPGGIAVKLNKTVVIVAAVFAVVIGVGVLLMGAGRDESEKSQIRIPQYSLEEEERFKLEQMVGSGLAGPVGSLTLAHAEKTSQGWMVRLESIVNSIKLDTLLDGAKGVFGEVKRADLRIAAVELQMLTDKMKDEYGRQLEKVPIAKIAFSGETFAKVVWDDFDPRDFSEIADVFWLHDELRPQEQTMIEERNKEKGALSSRQAG